MGCENADAQVRRMHASSPETVCGTCSGCVACPVESGGCGHSSGTGKQAGAKRRKLGKARAERVDTPPVQGSVQEGGNCVPQDQRGTSGASRRERVQIICAALGVEQPKTWQFSNDALLTQPENTCLRSRVTAFAHTLVERMLVLLCKEGERSQTLIDGVFDRLDATSAPTAKALKSTGLVAGQLALSAKDDIGRRHLMAAVVGACGANERRLVLDAARDSLQKPPPQQLARASQELLGPASSPTPHSTVSQVRMDVDQLLPEQALTSNTAPKLGRTGITTAKRDYSDILDGFALPKPARRHGLKANLLEDALAFLQQECELQWWDWKTPTKLSYKDLHVEIPTLMRDKGLQKLFKRFDESRDAQPKGVYKKSRLGRELFEKLTRIVTIPFNYNAWSRAGAYSEGVTQTFSLLKDVLSRTAQLAETENDSSLVSEVSDLVAMRESARLALIYHFDDNFFQENTASQKDAIDAMHCVTCAVTASDSDMRQCQSHQHGKWSNCKPCSHVTTIGPRLTKVLSRIQKTIPSKAKECDFMIAAVKHAQQDISLYHHHLVRCAWTASKLHHLAEKVLVAGGKTLLIELSCQEISPGEAGQNNRVHLAPRAGVVVVSARVVACSDGRKSGTRHQFVNIIVDTAGPVGSLSSALICTTLKPLIDHVCNLQDSVKQGVQEVLVVSNRNMGAPADTWTSFVKVFSLWLKAKRQIQLTRFVIAERGSESEHLAQHMREIREESASRGHVFAPQQKLSSFDLVIKALRQSAFLRNATILAVKLDGTTWHKALGCVDKKGWPFLASAETVVQDMYLVHRSSDDDVALYSYDMINLVEGGSTDCVAKGTQQLKPSENFTALFSQVLYNVRFEVKVHELTNLERETTASNGTPHETCRHAVAQSLEKDGVAVSNHLDGPVEQKTDAEPPQTEDGQTVATALVPQICPKCRTRVKHTFLTTHIGSCKSSMSEFDRDLFLHEVLQKWGAAVSAAQEEQKQGWISTLHLNSSTNTTTPATLVSSTGWALPRPGEASQLPHEVLEWMRNRKNLLSLSPEATRKKVLEEFETRSACKRWDLRYLVTERRIQALVFPK